MPLRSERNAPERPLHQSEAPFRSAAYLFSSTPSAHSEISLQEWRDKNRMKTGFVRPSWLLLSLSASLLVDHLYIFTQTSPLSILLISDKRARLLSLTRPTFLDVTKALGLSLPYGFDLYPRARLHHSPHIAISLDGPLRC